MSRKKQGIVITSRVSARGLAALKLRTIRTDVNFGKDQDDNPVQINTDVDKEGVGGVNVKTNWS